MIIREDLELDMPGMLHKMFDVHRIIPECHLRFLLSRIKAVLKLFRRLRNPHSFAAATESCLDDYGISNLRRRPRSGLCVEDRIFASRYDRDTRIDHRIPCLRLVPQTLDNFGSGTDKCNIALFAQLCELTVLRQETKSRMDRIRT